MNHNSNRQSFGDTAVPQLVSTPPPVGYPGNNNGGGGKDNCKLESKRKGDGFWKGCFAALCCCCVLDACF